LAGLECDEAGWRLEAKIHPKGAKTGLASTCILLCSMLWSCGRPASSPPPGVSASAERGPIRLLATAAPSPVWVGDPITLELLVETPADYLVQFAPDPNFSPLDLRGQEEPQSFLTSAGTRRWRMKYTLESLVAGSLAITPPAVRYARSPGDPGQPPDFEHELAAGALAIEVRSALTTQDSVERPRDITGTLAVPPRPLSLLEVAALAGGAALAGAGAVALYLALRRRRARPPPPLPPEVLALRELDQLNVEQWWAAGRVKEYYYRLTEIVRVYIERKFGLAAPEMTTEEFLKTLSRRQTAVPYDRQRLAEFLKACDLVKYAAATPSREDAAAALAAARAFVNATAVAAAREPSAAGTTEGRAA
jgi:hypothetical protein